MKNLISIIFVVMFLILAAGAAACAEDKIVKVTTLNDYAPFCVADKKHSIEQLVRIGSDADGFSGYSWEILRESFHAVGYTIHLSVVPWVRAMHDVKKGKADILFPTGKNTKRQKIFDYSAEPTNEAFFLVYVRADSKIEWNGLASLHGLTIGVKKGFNYGDQWMAATGIDKYDVLTISQGFKMLIADRLDGFLGYEYNWDYYLKQAGLKYQFRKLPVFDSSAEYLVALKSNPNGKTLLKAFDAGKRKLILNGKLDGIKHKWFGN